LHTVLGFYLKPQYVLDDTAQLPVRRRFGCYLGNTLVRVRLESFEAHRLLTIEKEDRCADQDLQPPQTFETLTVLETTDAEQPSGILMLDIVTSRLSTTPMAMPPVGQVPSSFWRSADEICTRHPSALLSVRRGRVRGNGVWVRQEETVLHCRGLRIAVQSLEMDGHRITVSIGVAYCGDEQVRNFENVIDRATRPSIPPNARGGYRVYMEQEREAGRMRLKVNGY
jgi:hypothetical protein